MTTSDVTRLLVAWHKGDEDAQHRLMPLVYQELRRIATAHLRRERPNHTLEPTALIHEAYLRLVEQEQPAWNSRLHFFAIASRLMRQVLVDAARARRSAKRGQGNKADLSEGMAVTYQGNVDLLQLDSALEELARIDERKCRAIEMKYFGGLTRLEIAAALGSSSATVGRDIQFAEAWLKRQLVPAE